MLKPRTHNDKECDESAILNIPNLSCNWLLILSKTFVLPIIAQKGSAQGIAGCCTFANDAWGHIPELILRALVGPRAKVERAPTENEQSDKRSWRQSRVYPDPQKDYKEFQSSRT